MALAEVRWLHGLLFLAAPKQIVESWMQTDRFDCTEAPSFVVVQLLVL